MARPAAAPPSGGEDDDAAALAYVLALDPGPARRRFEVALLDDPQLAAEVWRAEAALRPLADVLRPVRPHPRVYAAAEDRVFGRDAVTFRAARRAARFWRAVAGVLAFAAAGAATALLLVVGRPDLVRQDGAIFAAAIVRTDGAIVLVRLQPGGRLLAEAFPVEGAGDPHLWLLRDATPAVPLGVLAETRRADLPLPADLALGDGARLVVTLEPAGAQGVAPSGPRLGFGSLVRL